MINFFKRAKPPAPPRIEPSVRYASASNAARFGDMNRRVGSADTELMNSLGTLRSRARMLAMNSSAMQRFISLMQDNVVGNSGFNLRCRVRKADRSLDVSLNERVQAEFLAWAEGSMTTDGQMGWVEFWRQMVEAWARDGEAIFEFVRGDYLDGLALNPIESDMLDETLNTLYPQTGNEIRMGVELNADGRPVAYHFLTLHPGDAGWYGNKNSTTTRYRRVLADRVVHIFIKRRPGQTRGEPPTASILRDLKMMDGYREAEVTGRRVAASTMGFFVETPTAGGAGGIEALATPDSKQPESEGLEMSLEPGTFKKLPRGLGLQQFDAKASSVDFKQFETQIGRSIAQGLGISAFSLVMQTDGVSYSTARTVVIEDRDFYRGKQRMFLRPAKRVFDEWLKSRIMQPGTMIPASRYEIVRTSSKLVARGWAWVDPAKDVSSNAEALRTRQTSLSRIAADRGIDFDELLDEIENDEAELKRRGITVIFSELTENPDDGIDDADGVKNA